MINKTSILALILCTIGIILCIYFNPGIKPKSFTVNLAEKQQLVGEIYLPKAAAQPYPTMILTHGINSNKESMSPLALELSRHGIAAVTFDFGNNGESYHRNSTKDIQQINLLETEAIINYFKQFPDLFDHNKMGIAGHSMGGTVALDFAKINPEIKTTVLLAIGGEADPESPKNLLYAMGLYDELNPTWMLKNNLKEASNQPATDGNLIGNFSQGNARKLVFSPVSDHFIAPYDSVLINEIIAWLIQSFGLNLEINYSRITYYILGMMLVFFGLILEILSLVEKIKFLAENYYLVNGLYLTFIAIVWGLSYQKTIHPVMGSNLLLFILVSQGLVNYALLEGKAWKKKIKILVIYGIILSLSFLLPTAIANGLPEIVQHPNYLLKLPLFLIHWQFLIIYNIGQNLKQELFDYHTIDLIPSYKYFIVLASISVFANRLIKKIKGFCKYLINKLRQPLKITGLGTIDKRSLFAILVLLLILVIILYYQGQKGLIAEVINRGLDGLKLFLQQLFFPSLIFIGILRSRWLRKLENYLYFS